MDNSPVDPGEVDEIYQHLTTNHKAVFGKGTLNGAWANLNARFIQGTGDIGLNLENIIKMNPDGTFVTKLEPLDCKILTKDFVEIDFNRQGFPNIRSRVQEYQQGNNIYFYPHVLNMVTGFYADSVLVDLYCDWNPSLKVASLRGTHLQKIK